LISQVLFNVEIKMLGRIKATVIAVLLATAAPVAAADMDDAAMQGGWFGNVHVGEQSYFDRVNNEDIWLPSVNIGGKLAYESDESPWGVQGDIDLDYADFSWLRPKASAGAGGILSVDSASHLTYRTSEYSKIGVYGGSSLIAIDDGADTLELHSASLGVEGLTTINEQTWIQGRVGLLDPYLFELDGADSELDIFDEIWGGNIGGSIHHAFSSNISARAMANFAYLGIERGDDAQIYSVGAAGNYTFDTMPLSIGMSVGYSALYVDNVKTGGVTLGSSLTYSFGGPSQGSTGKLFSSGLLGFNL
jgi:hypothetical protein